MTIIEDYKNATHIGLRSLAIAHTHEHEYVTLDHVFLALLEQPEVTSIIERLHLDPNDISDPVRAFLCSDHLDLSEEMPLKTNAFIELFLRVVGKELFTKTKPLPFSAILEVFLSMSPDDSYANLMAFECGLTRRRVHDVVTNSTGPLVSTIEGTAIVAGSLTADEVIHPEKTPHTLAEAREKLLRYTTDLNDEARRGRVDPVIGRAIEVDDLIHVLARRRKNNAVLVGEPGVGKTAVVSGLAYRIQQGEVPEDLKGARIFALDVGKLVAGTRFRGDFEERVTMLLDAMKLIDGSILFIDEIHTILDAGTASKGGSSAANLLKPALANGTLRCIGATTLEEYRRHVEKDAALVRRFRKIQIDEPSPEVCRSILYGLQAHYETFHRVTYTRAAIDAAVHLSHRHLHTLRLPDKAIDLIDNAGARQKITSVEHRVSIIDVTEIEAEVARLAKIPQKTVSSDETERLARLEADLLGCVVGQDAAVHALVDAVFVSRADMREPGKPAGCYLFVGPTGVGKTEMARALASSLGIPLVKFDMSEYMEPHSISRLIGSPPGYVGFGDGAAGSGMLVNAIDTTPACVLLLDEVEKAHPDILPVLLQVMEDATLTSGQGKTVRFDNVFLIMTSNAGAAKAERGPLGFGAATEPGADPEAIKRTFSPEFRNRLDKVVAFAPLPPEHVGAIVKKIADQISERASKRGVKVVFRENALAHLSQSGYHPLMGARPIKRLMQEKVSTPISRQMMTGVLRNGGIATVTATSDDIDVHYEAST